MATGRAQGRLLLSYRLSLAIAIPILVGLTGAVVLLLNKHFTRKSVDLLAQALFRDVAGHAVERTRAQLGQAVPVVEVAAATLGAGAHGGDPKFQDDLIAVARAHPELTWVSYSDASGAFTGVFHGSHGEWRLNLSHIEDGKTALTEFDLDDAGRRTLRRHEDDSGYDPRTRPFYRLAAEAHRRVWTPPYVFYDETVPGITCAAPAYSTAGELTGVFTVDMDLNQLSTAMSQLRSTPNGRVFLYAADGTLIAHPSVQLVMSSGKRGEGKLVATHEVNDPVLQEFMAHAGGPAEFTFERDGEQYAAMRQSVEVDRGLTWILGAYFPESDFTGDIQAGTRATFWLSILAVVLALGLSLYLAARMAKPLAAVATEMEKVGEFRLEQRPLPRSSFREIAVLNRALETMKGSLRSFASYVPKDLVRAVVDSGQEAKLEGKLKDLTIFFSDVANFTTFAETMKPDALVSVLGSYFEEMTRIIGAHGGTVDKFIGDGIMAFWGAPGDLPDHAERACLAALACQKRLAELRADPSKPWMQRLGTRIGIATGEVLVGNIGTLERMNYTVMGDDVNLASRLEGLNKAYGTAVLAGEATIRATGGRVLARPLDVVAVKGKERGVRVFEILGPAQDATAEQRELASMSEGALGAYLRRDFGGAAQGYRAIVARFPRDKAAPALLQRCEAFVGAPPPADWNGVHAVHEK